MKRNLAGTRRFDLLGAAVLLYLAMTPSATAAQTLIEFEGQPRGTSFIYPEHQEGGFLFRDPLPPDRMARSGGGIPNRPENGGSYLQFLIDGSLVFDRLDSSPFNLLSLDLAEYSTVFPFPRDIPVVGERADGIQVSVILTLDGVIDGTGPLQDFQTFTFGPEFANLVRVRIPTDLFSIDNVLVDVTPGPKPISIDIRPGSDPNALNPASRGAIPVAILTTETFDASMVSPGTERFGPGAASMVHKSGHFEDVDSDGDLDLVLHFRTQETGIHCGDTEASLTAETFGGEAIQGSDSVQTVGCRSVR